MLWTIPCQSCEDKSVTSWGKSCNISNPLNIGLYRELSFNNIKQNVQTFQLIVTIVIGCVLFLPLAAQVPFSISASLKLKCCVTFNLPLPNYQVKIDERLINIK